MNDNGMSSAYRSLHINTSRGLMAVRDLPDAEALPRLPAPLADRRLLRRLRRPLRLPRPDPLPHRGHEGRAGAGGGGCERHPRRRRDETRYDAVLVANGHHWDARWPEPPFPGEFDGRQMHAHDYKTPGRLEDQNVLVLGIGNSATDIAVETSRVVEHDLPRDAPRRLRDPQVPEGQAHRRARARSSRAGCRSRSSAASTSALLDTVQGEMEDYGLPKPDHKLLEAHPTISSTCSPRIGHGRITLKPNIERLEGDERALHRRHHRADRHDRLLHGLQDHVPVPLRRAPAGPRQPRGALPARGPARACRASTSSA